jgi:hypothetical protein
VFTRIIGCICVFTIHPTNVGSNIYNLGITNIPLIMVRFFRIMQKLLVMLSYMVDFTKFVTIKCVNLETCSDNGVRCGYQLGRKC